MIDPKKKGKFIHQHKKERSVHCDCSVTVKSRPVLFKEDLTNIRFTWE